MIVGSLLLTHLEDLVNNQVTLCGWFYPNQEEEDTVTWKPTNDNNFLVIFFGETLKKNTGVDWYKLARVLQFLGTTV
jgi:hypothetical protein